MKYAFDVVCEQPQCSNTGKVVNTITVELEPEGIETYVEGWRPEDADTCQACGTAGVLQDPEVIEKIQVSYNIGGMIETEVRLPTALEEMEDSEFVELVRDHVNDLWNDEKQPLIDGLGGCEYGLDIQIGMIADENGNQISYDGE